MEMIIKQNGIIKSQENRDTIAPKYRRYIRQDSVDYIMRKKDYNNKEDDGNGVERTMRQVRRSK